MPRGKCGLLVTYLLFCTATILPLFAVRNPPIVDFANHAARLSLACSMGDPVIASMYQYRLGLIPNLAADLINLPLCGLIHPDVVLKGVVAASLALIYLSGWIIQRTLAGRANPFLLFLPAISFNLVLSAGYINFLAGIAAAIATVALALLFRRRPLALILLGNAGGVVLFFLHIFALAFAMVAMFGLELGRSKISPRAIVAAGMRTLPMFALPLMLIPFVPGDGSPPFFSYAGKLRVLLAPFLGYTGRPESIALVMAALLYATFRNRRASIDPALRVPLACLAIYIVLLPGTLQATGDVDARTMVAAAYLFVIALQPCRSDWKVTAGAALAAGVVLAIHLSTVATVWLPFDRQVREFRQSLDVLAPQARILSVEAEGGPARAAPPFYYWHLASYATLDRRVFNPLDFTGIGMQPLSSRPAFAAIDTPAGIPLTPAFALRLAAPTRDLRQALMGSDHRYALDWPRRFDYVLFYHFGSRPNFAPSRLRVVRQGSWFSILRIER